MTIREILNFIVFGDLPTSYFLKRGMRVGKNFQRQTRVMMDPSHCWLIRMGDDVGLASGVRLLAHDDTSRIYTGYGRIGEIVIGNRVAIGANATITMNTHIGDDVIVAAGSLVNKDIPSNTVVAGVPAKKIGRTSDFLALDAEHMKVAKKFDCSYSYYHNVNMDKKKELQKYFEEHPGEIAYLDLGKFETGKLCK